MKERKEGRMKRSENLEGGPRSSPFWLKASEFAGGVFVDIPRW